MNNSNHIKMMIIDGKIAFSADDSIVTVGTINMDYRSLYLHFECGVFMQDVDILKDVKKDILDAIKVSHLVTKKEATEVI